MVALHSSGGLLTLIFIPFIITIIIKNIITIITIVVVIIVKVYNYFQGQELYQSIYSLSASHR